MYTKLKAVKLAIKNLVKEFNNGKGVCNKKNLDKLKRVQEETDIRGPLDGELQQLLILKQAVVDSNRRAKAEAY